MILIDLGNGDFVRSSWILYFNMLRLDIPVNLEN